ncbi:MAG: hypothetical protein JSU01_23780 [Bacteroidetes bacterium]|nr:hypothetical protein [Bacteroidota bacterium]
MKTKITLIVLLLSGAVLTFSGCKKSSNSGPALTPKQVSSQIALNITQTLESGFGAFGLSSGLNAPGNIGLVPKGRLMLNAPTNPLCGTIADTTLNYTTTDGGVSASVKGDLKFAFNCTNNEVSGFNVTDNLTIAESTPEFSVSYKLIEDLTIAAVTPGSGTTNITLNGSLSFGGNFSYKTGSKGSGTQNFSYTFHSVTADDSGQIISGSADFNTSGTGSTGVWNYTGTVTFLGNGQANIVINGTTYHADLNTGVVS